MNPFSVAKLSGKMLYTTASCIQSGMRSLSARWLKGSWKYSERSAVRAVEN